MIYYANFKIPRKFNLGLVVLTLMVLLLASFGGNTARAADDPTPIQGWQDTGFNITGDNYNFCFDATQPDTLLFVHQRFVGQVPFFETYSYNFNTKELSSILTSSFTTCNQSTGQLYL